MTPLEHFEKRVKEHTLQLDSRTKDTALIWDLWCALKETRAEYETFREAYGRLMQGVEEKMRKSTFADCVPGPRNHAIIGIPGEQTVPEWLIGAVDRLRNDYKDGNYYRSKQSAEELLIAIDAAGYAIVPKTELETLRADNEKLRAKMKRIGELNAENLADLDALLGPER